MAASSPASVSVRELTKHYGSVPAVTGVSLEVRPGEIFGLLGPNGAGKTTTLECILGLRRPDSGSIMIAGVDALARPEAARRRVGAQLQNAMLQDKISPRQALGLFASFYPDPAGIGELLEQFALGEKADANFDSLSGGQRQRLFLALAFVNQPQLVVLDEPTAGLDPQSRRDLHRMITGLRESGRTVLLSTHDLEEAHQLCDRLAVIDGGRVVAVAPPADLIRRSRTPARVSIRTTRPLAALQVRNLPDVVSVQASAGGWTLGTTNLTRTVVGVTGHLEAQGNELLDLEIHPPSLEDVFLELTGRAWPAEKT
jgi:ABC-2 type transport system ATP-binding protein